MLGSSFEDFDLYFTELSNIEYEKPLIANLPYLISQSIKGAIRNRMMLLPTVVTLFLCTLVTLVCLSLLSALYRVDLDSEEVWKVRVFLKQQLSEEQMTEVQSNLSGMLGIQKVAFVSAEEAKERFSKRYGEEWLEGLEENPLPASYELWPQSAFRNSYQLDLVADYIKAVPGVEEVMTSSESLRILESKKWEVVLGCSLLGALLMATLWLILRNSVRLSLYSRKLLVENMKYMGASHRFILFPFVFESLLLALLSGLGGILVWWPLLLGVQVLLPFLNLSSDLNLWMALGVLSLAVFMSVNSTIEAVRLFLRREGNFG